jgi:hypothetical protein
MCGRFTQAYTWHEFYRLTCPPVNIEPRYNIAPRQPDSLSAPAREQRSPTRRFMKAYAKEFLELVPYADYIDVSGARHMVTGDPNDHFSAAVLSFIRRLPLAE